MNRYHEYLTNFYTIGWKTKITSLTVAVILTVDWKNIFISPYISCTSNNTVDFEKYEV